MTWLQTHRLRRFLRSALWPFPAACMLAALLVAPLVRWLDDQTRWTLLALAAEGARNVVGALASSLLTFIVFAFSILLLAVQMASGQLTPRIIARVFEQPLTKFTVGAFVFAWVYAMAALGRVEDRVPQLSVALAILLSLASVGLFLYLIQRAIQSLRPVTLLTGIARDTRAVIEAVYPQAFSVTRGEHASVEPDACGRGKSIRHRGRSSAMLAFDGSGLRDIATAAGCTVEIVPQVGDFVSQGDELFRVHGPGADDVSELQLSRCVALGPERTLEQDPAFGFRIIVDIASKALSPAINDPTTGVLALDQLHYLLQLVAQRDLDTGVISDASGVVRVVYRTPDWEDFVVLAVTEIRLYGATSPQVTRRLQAMLEQLLRIVPSDRAPALTREVSLLRRTVERLFTDPEERALALRSDLQGFGGMQTDAMPPEPAPHVPIAGA